MLREITLDLILTQPEYTIPLTFAIIVAYHYIAEMPYTEFVVATRLKHYLFQVLSPFARKKGLGIVYTMEYREKAEEYVTTVDATPRVIGKKIRGNGFNPHLIAGSKRRKTPDGLQWSHTQWSYQHGDDKQTEVWFYTNDDNSTDIYAHVETTPFDPWGHLNDEQEMGDVRGAFKEAWEE